ncbi:E3 ubiquitin-protein ligase RNF144A isoform X2 [Ornithorhynchus anatinus]|uniref:RBR-type E3 ubiquitin transferase n=2 Tax=Ornithorhynchus anatinus TaxID=9258 RepID=A0A6I8N4T8_ORNAN|nr:E3 ubiquitin-protein ligase RNF144A isoform X2 [Ornithorhynchus anatinus]XP_039766180.1 E3 ubiquitin-protein ligase RNF144A isoform X2 [Ornithorhynchus anatinus]
MMTARYRPTWDLALDPLVSCKLCLGEYPVEQMTTIAQCQCIFCTLCLKQYVELLIREGLETAISCPDATCPKRGHLQENEIECMVATEIMQRYKKLQFEKEVLMDPCRTWCPSSTCQAVCQLQEAGPQAPQLVQCQACHLEFCSACKASWHPGQGCQEAMPITFLPGETRYCPRIHNEDRVRGAQGSILQIISPSTVSVAQLPCGESCTKHVGGPQELVDNPYPKGAYSPLGEPEMKYIADRRK